MNSPNKPNATRPAATTERTTATPAPALLIEQVDGRTEHHIIYVTAPPNAPQIIKTTRGWYHAVLNNAPGFKEIYVRGTYAELDEQTADP